MQETHDSRQAWATGLTEHLFKVAHSLRTVVNRGLSDLLEAHCHMEGF